MTGTTYRSAECRPTVGKIGRYDDVFYLRCRCIWAEPGNGRPFSTVPQRTASQGSRPLDPKIADTIEAFRATGKRDAASRGRGTHLASLSSVDTQHQGAFLLCLAIYAPQLHSLIHAPAAGRSYSAAGRLAERGIKLLMLRNSQLQETAHALQPGDGVPGTGVPLLIRLVELPRRLIGDEPAGHQIVDQSLELSQLGFHLVLTGCEPRCRLLQRSVINMDVSHRVFTFRQVADGHKNQGHRQKPLAAAIRPAAPGTPESADRHATRKQQRETIQQPKGRRSRLFRVLGGRVDPLQNNARYVASSRAPPTTHGSRHTPMMWNSTGHASQRTRLRP